MEKKPSSIDFRQLETFCRVAELKGFSKAANHLYLTQPTVSGHILALENSLHLRLFDRMGRETRLTKAGEVFYHHATRMLSYRKEALSALSEFFQGIRGELLLGGSTIPGEYILPRLIGEFKEHYPQISISLKIGDTKEIAQLVLQGVVEFGMLGAKIREDALQHEHLGEDEIIVIGPAARMAPKGDKISFDQVFMEPWIVREEGSGTQIAVEKALKKKGKSLKQLLVVSEMGSTSSIKQGVKAGLGLAFISMKAVEEELAAGSLRRVEVIGLEPISRPFYMVFHRGRTLSPIGEKFIQFLKKKRGGAF
jgi:DNA-binding transcriptional LysR family regulator